MKFFEGFVSPTSTESVCINGEEEKTEALNINQIQIYILNEK